MKKKTLGKYDDGEYDEYENDDEDEYNENRCDNEHCGSYDKDEKKRAAKNTKSEKECEKAARETVETFFGSCSRKE